MRVIVMGASGGIGSAVARLLEDGGSEVVRVGRGRVCVPYDVDAIVFAHGSHKEPIEDNLIAMWDLFDSAFDMGRPTPRTVVTMSGGGVGGPNLDELGDYTASKAAVAVWTEWVARRYPDRQFFCVAPGLTATKMTGYKGADPRIPAAFIVKLLSGKYGHLSGSLLAAQRDDLDTMKPTKLRRVECP